jgi:hypothetical protein
MTDSHALVTIARFYDVTQADLARIDLEASGIRVFLSNEGLVSTLWHLTGAIGGIKLQVAAADVDRAEAILSRSAKEEDETSDIAAETDDDDSATGESRPPEIDDDDTEPPLTRREENAERAFRGAVLGCLFPPLQLYAFWLLLRVMVSEDRLSGRRRSRAFLAAAISFPAIMFALWLLGHLLSR